jgi:hypothetical protein
VTLLGPQRRPTVGTVAASLPLGGPIATITAGWQEREPDDAELSRQLADRDVNLQLYRRWLDVTERDLVYAAGLRRLTEVLDELQELYLLRLDHEMQAVYAIQRGSGGGPANGSGNRGGNGSGGGSASGGGRANGRVRAEIMDEAVATARDLDAAHLHRVDGARGEFFEVLRPHDRPVIAQHRAEVARVLGEASALVVAGGHVGVLAGVLHLFNIAAALRSPVIAWSAGAMALSERIVLFHDRSAHGPGHPEVYGSGLSLVRGVVPLPHARARLLLDDHPRMAVFARRFAPDRCLLLENGTRIDTDGEGSWPPGMRVLAEDGRVTALASGQAA